MHVLRLATQQYRNLEDGEIFPCQGVNVIYGGNAQGKTNLLESLWLFTGGHSFRGAKDSELPRLDPATGENGPRAALALDFFSEEREQTALLRIENGRRSSEINGVKKKTGAALMGKVRAVIFSPEHLLLVKEGPARRRSFLDGALCQIRPSYAGLLTVYNRALLQRNALLKDISRFPELSDTLEVWDLRLADLGAQIMVQRRDYAQKLSHQVREVYWGISKGKEEVSLAYAPSLRALGMDFTRDQAQQASPGRFGLVHQPDVRQGIRLPGAAAQPGAGFEAGRGGDAVEKLGGDPHRAAGRRDERVGPEPPGLPAQPPAGAAGVPHLLQPGDRGPAGDRDAVPGGGRPRLPGKSGVKGGSGVFLHLGQNTLVDDRTVIGVFDLDNSTVSKHTRAFLARAQREDRVVSVSQELPKSFVVCRDRDGDRVYLSQLSPATLLRRASGGLVNLF